MERLLVAMGTGLRVEVLASDRPSALRASEAAVRALEAVEARLSTWRPESELSRANGLAPGAPFPLSAETAEELGRVLELSRRSAGALDPAPLDLVRAHDLRGAGRTPDPEELERAVARRVPPTLDPGGVLRRGTGELESGAWGKGAGLDRARVAGLAAGATWLVLDLGGQLVVAGDGPPLELPVAHPDARDRPALWVRLEDGSLAVSGNAERARVVDGRRVGHLLDPRTGDLAPDRGAAAVLAVRALDADALSTAAFVLGPEQALELCRGEGADLWWLERTGHDTPEGLAELRVHATPGARARTLRLAPHVRWADDDRTGAPPERPLDPEPGRPAAGSLAPGR